MIIFKKLEPCFEYVHIIIIIIIIIIINTIIIIKLFSLFSFDQHRVSNPLVHKNGHTSIKNFPTNATRFLGNILKGLSLLSRYMLKSTDVNADSHIKYVTS